MSQQFSTGEEAVEALHVVDMDDSFQVVEWIDIFLASEYATPDEPITNEDQWSEIVELFEEQGYEADANTEQQFGEGDRDEYAEYIVGQFLALAGSDDPINDLWTFVKGCSADWLEKFPSSDEE